MILEKVRQGVNIFLSALQIILVAYSIMSWITSPYNRLFAGAHGAAAGPPFGASRAR